MPIFGAKSRAKRGCASKLAYGHRIGLAERTDFTVVYSEFRTSQWADVGIGPYNWRAAPEGIRTPQITEHSDICNTSPPSFALQMPPLLIMRGMTRGGFGADASARPSQPFSGPTESSVPTTPNRQNHIF